MTEARLLVRLLVILVVLTSCSRHPKLPGETKTIVRWEQPFDLEKATFFIDGARIGVGVSAFDRVLKHLSGLRKGDHLVIQFPRKWSTMQLDGKVNNMWEFPFEGHLDKEKEFTKLCGEKDLGITFETFE